MKNLINLLMCVCALFTLNACVQVPIENSHKEQQLAITSARDLPNTYPAGSFYALAPKYVEATSLAADQTKTIYQMYGDAIENDLQQHGFLHSTASAEAIFYVGFGVALTQDFSDAQLTEKFGITPGLSEQSTLKKGSLLIYIKDAKSGKIVWRSIAQGFANEALSPSQRKVRIQGIVSAVLKQFYQSN